MPYDERGITPSVECTHHKAVSKKASLQFFLPISPFTPYEWICSQMSLPECVHDAVSKLRNIKKMFSMWDEWTYLSHSSFTESFFPGFSEYISFFTVAVHILSNAPCSVFSKWDSAMLYEKKTVTLWVEFTRPQAAPQISSLQYLSEDIFVFMVGLKVLPSIP